MAISRPEAQVRLFDGRREPGRVMRRVVVLASLSLALAAAPAPAADSGTAPTLAPRAASTPRDPYCPVAPVLYSLDAERYVVLLTALERGRVSGVVSLYSGPHRYDIAFRNAVAVDKRDALSDATPIVVRFKDRAALDGAVVTSIEDNGRQPCEPPFEPWRIAQFPMRNTNLDVVLANARRAASVDAPDPVDDPVSCPQPYRAPTTLEAYVPRTPWEARNVAGTALVLVLIGADDRVLGARIEKTAGDKALDIVALDAAARSRYQGAIFRCKHVIGAHLFQVDFNHY